MALADTLDQAARKGDEAAVRQLLAEGVRPDQATAYGWLPLHFASFNGHQRVARLLLEAAPDTALAVDDYGWTPLHHLGYRGDIEVLKLLLLAAPAAATVLDAKKWAPIHHAAYRSNAASVQLLLEAAPEVAFALDDFGRTPLHLVLLYANHRMTEQVVETARCLLRAAPARSTAEAGWLVGRLGKDQRKRLRAAALSLVRAQHSSAVLPAELSGHILALCLLDA
ncbi:hypothetical protein CHLNCDRAFT_135942 [Chlorella variabilis]|uniref:Uncharacterized protein n=1 Tax=Chlorella variabilis TaxID=554065 RepID=E1ZJF2_CHLVA|nr:hypothetical protein CHLNCDRAFT_135942 [Chlorella variabilis]EFN53983.1 hypothetical protein CHLNCDRAFT_135942 [Chlorella variabilis]|eukprot:XP_005846085.1 hypothetical protein CHLNCDRAFT_135942 [Chlorella variabilis]